MSDNGKNGHAVYTVIRTGDLFHALARFRDRFAAEPVAVVVNAGLVEQVEAAAVGAGLDIEVTSSGGCLLGEIWLRRPAADPEPEPAVDVQAAAEAIRPRSLTWRADQARRAAGPMTAERARTWARQLALELEVGGDV